MAGPPAPPTSPAEPQNIFPRDAGLGHMAVLADELVPSVLALLPPRDLDTVAACSRVLFLFAREESLWQPHSLSLKEPIVLGASPRETFVGTAEAWNLLFENFGDEYEAAMYAAHCISSAKLRGDESQGAYERGLLYAFRLIGHVTLAEDAREKGRMGWLAAVAKLAGAGSLACAMPSNLARRPRSSPGPSVGCNPKRCPTRPSLDAT